MSDRAFALYERAVQSPLHEIGFIARAYDDAFGRAPTTLREDFAGTALVAQAFARSDPARTAVAVDVDPAPLAYARRVHLGTLSSHVARRVTLVEGDARTTESAPVDVIYVGNFSLLCLHEDDALVGYLAACRARLAPDGVLVFDVMGGDARLAPGHVEETAHAGFTMRFTTEEASLATRRARFVMDLIPRGEPPLLRAFTYDWRVFTVDELAGALARAGFDEHHLYVEGRDARGRVTGRFTRASAPPDEERFVAYLVGVRRARAST